MTLLPETETLPSGLWWKNVTPLNWKRFSISRLAPYVARAIARLALCILKGGLKSSSRCNYAGQKIITAPTSQGPEQHAGEQCSRPILGSFSPRMRYYNTSAHRLR